MYNFLDQRTGWGIAKSSLPRKGTRQLGHLDGHTYFKGINICTLLIGQEGNEIDNFSFSDLDLGKFRKIIDTIDISNRYRLQPDLNTIIANNTSDVMRANTQKSILTSTPADLPIVTVRHAVEFIEYPPNTQPSVIKTIINRPLLGEAETYRCVAYNPNDYKTTLQREKAWSDYLVQRWSLNIESIQDFVMVRNNHYTYERRGDEAIDEVQTVIKTYRLEKDYIERRRNRIVLPALQAICPGTDRPINIAIVASGGGSRAMFATYGALKGLHDIGVLNATSYICGLSGSTWAISSIFTEVNNNGTTNLRTALNNAAARSVEYAPGFNFITEVIFQPVYRALMENIYREPSGPINRITGPIDRIISKVDPITLAAKLAQPYLYSVPATIKVKELLKQPITNTDYYGNAIARYLLGKGNTVYENNYVPDYLTLQLGEQARWQGKNYELPQAYVPHLPFPIYTAVTPLRNVEPSLFPWFEFTPYQIGTVLNAGDNKTGMFVKTWSFGRKFKNGISADYAPEQSLEFFLGIFSSAMNSSLKETLNMILFHKPSLGLQRHI